MSRRSMLWSMVAVLLAATALRLVAFGQVPPGLYHDEAYNGLDALDVLGGHFPLYFPANNGREPLFIYLVALAVGLLGKSPFALRLGSFFVGTLTIAATCALGRVLFSRRVGLLAAAVLAVTLWHVHLSRVGFRAVLLPLFIALAVWQGAVGVKGERETRRQGDKGQEARRRTQDARGWRQEVASKRQEVGDRRREVEERRGKREGWYHWLAAGVFYGLSFYTYTAARFTPVALVTFGLYVLATQPTILHSPLSILHPLWRGVGLAALAALVVIMPLAVYTIQHPDVVLGRPRQVFFFDPAINGGDLWGTLGTHILRTAGMFFVRGDRIWRHNVPWRPVFDPLLGGAFVVGFLVALCRARRDPAAGFVLVWTAVMTLPTLLAEDAPHFLRGVGVLPVVALLPALGLDWLAVKIKLQMANRKSQISKSANQQIGKSANPQFAIRNSQFAICSLFIVHCVILVFPILFGLSSTAWAYFGDYARNPMTGYWFERGAVALAGQINGFLGMGWDGRQMLHGSPAKVEQAFQPAAQVAQTFQPADVGQAFQPATRQVYLDPVLWNQWPQVRFLVAAPQVVTIGLEKEPTSNLQVAVFVWPYDDWQRAWVLLPTPAEVAVEEGPLSQGDPDPEPYTTYLAFFAVPPDPAAPALARFSGGVELLGVIVTPLNRDTPPLIGGDKGGLQVRLRWRATAPLAEDYAVFLHYLRDGERIAQADSTPASGYYPTTAWHPGDVVNDDHYVDGIGAPLLGHDTLLFGLWQAESGAVLYRLDEAGNPAGDWIEVPVDGY